MQQVLSIDRVPCGLMLHHFTGPAHPVGQGALTSDDLNALLLRIGPERFLSPEEWILRHQQGLLMPGNLCLTLDDGLRCQFDVALPVLKRHGILAFWFVYSSVFQGSLERLEVYRYFRTTAFNSIHDFYNAFFEHVMSLDQDKYTVARASFRPANYLSEFPFYSSEDRWFRFLRDEYLGQHPYYNVMDQLMDVYGFNPSDACQSLWLVDDHLRELSSSGHEIGLHSTTHPTRLSLLDINSQRHEYTKNYNHIHQVTGRLPRSMSHPCNSYTSHTLSILRDMNIHLGFRSNMSVLSNPSSLELPREDHANLLVLLSS